MRGRGIIGHRKVKSALFCDESLGLLPIGLTGTHYHQIAHTDSCFGKSTVPTELYQINASQAPAKIPASQPENCPPFFLPAFSTHGEKLIAMECDFLLPLELKQSLEIALVAFQRVDRCIHGPKFGYCDRTAKPVLEVR